MLGLPRFFCHARKCLPRHLFSTLCPEVTPTTVPHARAKPIRICAGNVMEFLRSFDVVISDCDGVVWSGGVPLPGVIETYITLRDLGKRLLFASNNSTRSQDAVAANLRKYGLDIPPEDIVYPALIAIDYLKTIAFQKKLYVIGTETSKGALRQAGFDVKNSAPFIIEEKYQCFCEALEEDPDVGAVVVDFSFNTNYVELMNATISLRRKDCLFLVCIADRVVAHSAKDVQCIGPGHFSRILEEMTGRTPVVLGKPSTIVVDYFKHRMDIRPERTLVIGDSLQTDIALATGAGLKSLLVLTGVTSEEDLGQCTPLTTPTYLIPSVGDIASLVFQARGRTNKPSLPYTEKQLPR